MYEDWGCVDEDEEICVICGEAIRRGEWAFCVEEGYLHDSEECLWSYLLDRYSFREVADLVNISGRSPPADTIRKERGEMARKAKEAPEMSAFLDSRRAKAQSVSLQIKSQEGIEKNMQIMSEAKKCNTKRLPQ